MLYLNQLGMICSLGGTRDAIKRHMLDLVHIRLVTWCRWGLPEQFLYSQQELSSPAAMLAATLGITGPAYVHSSACASSAKALASAARLIRMDVCDAVLTGGVDS